MGLKEVFVALEDLGVVNVVIPFVIIFVVLFAVFEKVKMFKDSKINAVLSVVISFIAIAAVDVAKNINLFSYYLVLLLFGGIIILIFLGIFGGMPDVLTKERKWWTMIVFFILLSIALLYGLYASGVRPDLGPISYDWLSRLVPIAVCILVFIAVVWFVTSGGKAAAAGAGAGAGSGVEAEKKKEEKEKEKAKAEAKGADKSKKEGEESEDTIEVPVYKLKKLLEKFSDKDKIEFNKL